MKFIDLGLQYQKLKTSIDAGIQTVLDHNQYIMGPEVKTLENRLAQYVGVKHCIGVSSGTDALTISLMALNIGPGDEVLMPGFTYIATAEAVAFLGAKPVFVDIDPETFNLDPDQLEDAINTNTKCIMAVSLYGQCADFDCINAIAAKHGLPVIEDGAQSFGATYHGKRSCGLSTLGTTSFFPSKPLGCYGDGGAIFTNDDELATLCGQIRKHGEESRYHHVRVGLNGRLDSIQAAILLSKMEIFDQELDLRQTISARYIAELKNIPGIGLPNIQHHNRSAFAQFTIRVADRETFRAHLKDADIPTAVHYPLPIYKQPAYKQDGVEFPHSEKAAREVVSLPFGPWMTEAEQDQVLEAIRTFAQRRT